jgi:hypothetical protein
VGAAGLFVGKDPESGRLRALGDLAEHAEGVFVGLD